MFRKSQPDASAAPAPQPILDQNGKPLPPPPDEPSQGNAALDMLALGAGALLLLSAGKSRSMLGGLVKGGAAAALLGRAAKNTGALGKVAGVLHGAPRGGKGR